MKFYSELTGELFDSEKELVTAENKIREAEAKRLEAEKVKKEARATKAKEVEKAIKDANAAQSKAIKLLKDFTNDYGYFHMSYSTDDTKNEDTLTDVNDFFNLMTSFLK